MFYLNNCSILDKTAVRLRSYFCLIKPENRSCLFSVIIYIYIHLSINPPPMPGLIPGSALLRASHRNITFEDRLYYIKFCGLDGKGRKMLGGDGAGDRG